MTSTAEPELQAHWHPDGTVTLRHEGQNHTFATIELALQYVVGAARSTPDQRSLRIRTVSGRAPATLVVSPQGRYHDEDQPEVWGMIPDNPLLDAITNGRASDESAATTSAANAPGRRAAPPSSGTLIDRPAPRRASFVDDTPPELPPTSGWRGAAARLGLRVEPSPTERAERGYQDIVSQHWAGPRTIAVVNGKGGVGKTTTAICLAATFARYGGLGVLAWDNNQTRGTLGWRTERGSHDGTTLDLIENTERMLGANAQMADLAHYVHHQKQDRFDVLRSQPLKLAADQRISPEHVARMHAVAAKYYRLIIMDSGNDESDPIWQQMISHADQLVVAMGTRADHAEAGALLLEALQRQGGHAAQLATDSVVVISQGDIKATHDDLARLSYGFRNLSRAAVTVRHDQGMVDGALRLSNLKATTQRDWLRAAAAVAEGL